MHISQIKLSSTTQHTVQLDDNYQGKDPTGVRNPLNALALEDDHGPQMNICPSSY